MHTEREDHEKKLSLEKDTFFVEIESYLKEIDGLKDFGSRYLAKDVNEKIIGYNDRLNEMIAKRDKINKDEDDLGTGSSEFPRLVEA